MLTKDKIRGMFHGASMEQSYVWEMIKASAESFIESKSFDIENQAEFHIRFYEESKDKKWSETNRKSFARLKSGVPLQASGKLNDIELGYDSSVCAKLAPMSAYVCLSDDSWKDNYRNVIQLCNMTHRTSMAISGCMAHTTALWYCLSDKDGFSLLHFINGLLINSARGRQINIETFRSEADLTIAIDQMAELLLDKENTIVYKKLMKKDSNYILHSLPFVYSAFAKKPNSLDIYKEVKTLGASDEDLCMLGSLLGAFNGTKLFPSISEESSLYADKFCSAFQIK